MSNNNHRRPRRCHHCGCVKMARECWRNFPYYGGPCPDVNGCYGYTPCDEDDDNDNDRCGRCGRRNRWDRDDRCDRCNRCDRCDRCDQDEPVEQVRGNSRSNRNGRRRDRCCCRFSDSTSAVFTASTPLAVSANGIVPLLMYNPGRDCVFTPSGGSVRLEEAGTYLAMYTVQVPEGAELTSTLTLNVNGVAQYPATLQQTASNPVSTVQTIFDAEEGDTVSLRTSEAISLPDASSQPAFNLALIKLDE